jgi:hypothetical protein
VTKWADFNLVDEIEEAETPPADDVGFVDAMLADIEPRLPVDDYRIERRGGSPPGGESDHPCRYRGRMLALLMAAALAPCAPETPPALALQGIPAVAIPGRTYEASLVGDGAVVDRAGSDIGVTDKSGRGWSAHYEYARGVKQAFSVGLDRAPFTVTASWTEPAGDSAQCTRTVAVPLPIERRILALVNCKRGVPEPRSGLVLRCDGDRLRLRGLTWDGWDSATTTGRGTLNGRAATVRLSRPRECSTLDAFIYTRAKVTSDGRVLERVPIDCPLPS